ncbi:MAG: c-type cytochrome [Candidatus Marinarcus sp.]|uniref:c-type cytochrome n=1 Tax=Candidatus Marinarcus sp. TaxID=3100987 RepID=UPI003B007A73
MYMFEVKKTFIALCLTSSFLIASSVEKNVDGSVIYPRIDGKYNAYYINKQNIKGFTYGRMPTQNEIAAWNRDVMPDGTGLPKGEGSVGEGDELYSQHCVMCHGEFGSGGKGYPTLAGGQGTLKNQLLKEGDAPPIKTIGSYWPYATTLYWYIQSAMPFPHPKSLTNDETYALTAYLLSLNEIQIDGEDLDDDYVLNKEKMMKIKMPNVDGFYPVDPNRHDLKEQRPPLAQGERCMKNCNAPAPKSIAREIEGFDPAISTVKDLPEDSTKKAVVSFGEKVYNESCVSCHGNKAIGAPLFGDKEAWATVLTKGIDTVYKNAIIGVNAMPPRGGTDLTDKQMKEVINYMINSSK